jgi:hypothetical protein
MTDNMSESYQWLIVCLNNTNDWYYTWIILIIIGKIQAYHQSLIWFRHSMSHWYDSDISSVIGMKYVWIIPMTDNISESYQWLILCLNHGNDWWYIWIIPMTWYDSDIISIIGMIQTYYQSLVWFRHSINHWHDSDILSVIGMIQT